MKFKNQILLIKSIHLYKRYIFSIVNYLKQSDSMEGQKYIEISFVNYE